MNKCLPYWLTTLALLRLCLTRLKYNMAIFTQHTLHDNCLCAYCQLKQTKQARNNLRIDKTRSASELSFVCRWALVGPAISAVT